MTRRLRGPGSQADAAQAVENDAVREQQQQQQNMGDGGESRPRFGREMRRLFNFAETFTPLNHGSYGTFPRAVLEYRQQMERDFEARPDIHKRFLYPDLLRQSRALVAPLLGADTDEVVFVTNATTGVNTVVRNLAPFADGDVVLFPSSIYNACYKTIQSLEETTPLRGHRVDVTYPIDDEDLVARVRAAATALQESGKRVRLAIFDTIVSGPGVRVPWEELVRTCRALGILTLIDGAHGIGHIDLAHVGNVSPDFLVSNCHKWLYVPRGCAVLYVPFRNQQLIATTLPTSHGYLDPALRPHQGSDTRRYFTELFVDVATTDNSSYISVPAALRFRNDVCGGEVAIREYCLRLAQEGGAAAARILGTDVLTNKSGSITRCFLTNVRLPLAIPQDVSAEEAPAALAWVQLTAARRSDTYLQVFVYAGVCWVRFSAQIYLEVADFEWGARLLLQLLGDVKSGKWKEEESA